jgi:hypothetical protein
MHHGVFIFLIEQQENQKGLSGDQEQAECISERICFLATCFRESHYDTLELGYRTVRLRKPTQRRARQRSAGRLFDAMPSRDLCRT